MTDDPFRSLTMVEQEAKLAFNFPLVPWREPLPIETPEASGLACRICIAVVGVKSEDVGKLPRTKAAFDKHLGEVHPDGKCATCRGQKIVATAWSSGYPHATPCPECCPDAPCGCGLPPGECPSRDAIVTWKKERADA